ncbi:MAG TPA: hypothetical protein VL200_07065 [Lacunisphaera sp.]|jgi:hypothetical protein|nr:hypothetical protein [Lacunisphaera sp.]
MTERPEKILWHGRGTGDLTDAEVEQRAREIAVIRGRAARDVTEEDRAAAWAELRGDTRPPTSETDAPGGLAVGRDPSEPAGDSGHQVPDQKPSDEGTAAEHLAVEGVEEAQHDQMLAARARERRENRP